MIQITKELHIRDSLWFTELLCKIADNGLGTVDIRLVIGPIGGASVATVVKSILLATYQPRAAVKSFVFRKSRPYLRTGNTM